MIFQLLFPLHFNQISSSLVDMASRNIQSKYNVKKHYVGVIDAGSTGTRLNIYAFLQPGHIIAHYTTIKSHPGLHTLENDAIDAVINYLLQKAQEKMNNLDVKLTNITFTMQGTAGMRSMPEDQQKRIIKIVKDLFHKKKLKLKRPEVISGIREGFLALASLNILIDYKKNILTDFGCKDKNLRSFIQRLAPNYCKIKDKKVKYRGIMDMGGSSIQIVYEFDKKDSYDDATHVIHTIGKNIYINSYPGWGLIEGIKVLKKNENYRLDRKGGKSLTMFDSLLDDFREQDKPDINSVEEMYLSSYFYDKFKELGCKTITTLGDVSQLYKDKCKKTSHFCKEIYYMYKFLEAQGLKEDKTLVLVSDIAGIGMNWTLSSALMLSSEGNK